MELEAFLRKNHEDGFRALSVFLCCLLPLQTVVAQQLKREEIATAYIFNFAKNIEWQKEDRIPEFHFLIISNDKAINREMSNLSASRKLKGRPIRITISESVVIPQGIQLIFVTRGLKDLAEPVFRRIEGQNKLLITDGFDDKRIVMINLVETKDKTIKFEINKANILNQGLKVLPDMVLLGGTEIDVAKLYKESQDTVRSKDVKIADLRQHLDSLNVQIETARKEIGRQDLLIARQNQEISDRQKQLEMQRDTLSRQAESLSRQAESLSRQTGLLSQQTGLLSESRLLLKRQRSEIENGKTVLSNQQKKIDSQNASILKQAEVLEEQGTTIEAQGKIQRFLILISLLFLGLSYAIYRGYRIKHRSNRRLQEQEKQITRLNLDLQERAAALETANKELEAFSYSVSHDLRAPLRSIDGFSQAIIEDYEDEIGERGKDYLRRVRSAAQRMALLIDDMLNLSSVTRNEMVLRETDLSGMAEDIAGKLRELQPERQVDFVIQPGLRVLGDENLLRIALENLFNNAWKYTSKHPKARIELGSRASGRNPDFFVKDDGAGFDMKYAQKLFGAFQRMHTAEEFSGTGVGLATVQRIIHRHGGRIWAESEVEKGATFHFTLPGKAAEIGDPKIDPAG